MKIRVPPDALLLMVRRTPTGLGLESPMCGTWSTTVRGPVALGAAIDQAFSVVASTSPAVLAKQKFDLAAYDAAAEALSKAGRTLRACDVVVIRPDAERRDSRVVDGRRLDQHAPSAWKALDDGYWLSPSGRRYSPETAIVKRIKSNLVSAPMTEAERIRAGRQRRKEAG